MSDFRVITPPSADVFTLTGQYSLCTPATSADFSAGFQLDQLLNEQVACTNSNAQVINLVTDAVVTVDLGALTTAGVLVLKCDQPVTVSLYNGTLPEPGSPTTFGVDSILILTCASNPLTAMTIQRTPTIATQVRLVLAQTM